MRPASGLAPTFTIAGISALVVISLAGCRTDRHTIVEPRLGTRVVCQECYDEVVKVRRRSGHRGPSYTQNVSVHQCSQCGTQTSIYSENGVLMVKCAGCAPEGMACDKCLPPRDYTSPKPVEAPANN